MAAAKNNKKARTGRKCSICTCVNLTQINRMILKGVSFRNISLRVWNTDSHFVSVHRHTINCLKFDIAAVAAANKKEQAIAIHEEFREQLDFAKQLRSAAEEYLADPNDPLKLAILPRSDEIDVVYFDNTDLTAGDAPMPKKKTAKLAALLQNVEELRNIDVDKITIKHVDLRSFALDAIKTTDLCLDRFAKLSGAYQDNRANESDAEFQRLRLILEARAKQTGIDYKTLVREFADNYAATVPQKIVERLVSELEM